MIELEETVEINAPMERCFDLARSVDVHVASSVPLNGRAEAGRTIGPSELNDETTWSARFFGIRFRVTTRTLICDRPRVFHEKIVSGLPRRFEHHYSFESIGERSRMTDRFTVESRFGFVGALVDRLYLGPKMAKALQHRCAFLKHLAESKEWKKYLP
jgi:hypothetical protein